MVVVVVVVVAILYLPCLLFLLLAPYLAKRFFADLREQLRLTDKKQQQPQKSNDGHQKCEEPHLQVVHMKLKRFA